MLTRVYRSGLVLAALFHVHFGIAEEASPAVSQVLVSDSIQPVPQYSEEDHLNLMGLLIAFNGQVPGLGLSSEEVDELASGFRKFLAGELSIEALPQALVEQAFIEAQARMGAVASNQEPLPAFTAGSLEKVGAIIGLQTGVMQMGFVSEDASALAAGFIDGATLAELSPELEEQLPALEAFTQARLQEAQAALIAEQERAREAIRAKFRGVSEEWSVKEPMNVILETTQGEIELELFPQESPLAVANFVGHIENGYYDGLIFHRVIQDFMIQGGDPLGTGQGGESIWGVNFPDEFSDNLRFDQRGLLAMANAGPETNGSQFFITTSMPLQLNERHTIFGKVVRGYENVVAIETVEVNSRDKPIEDQVILKAYIKE